MSNVDLFKEEHPSLESYWRSIILFGRNVASYKFALGKTLLELSKTNQSKFTYEQLAVPFSKYLCEHIKKAPKQATSQTSKFLEACQNYNNGLIREEDLITITAKLGFVNVIDAFHIVNRDALPIRFYEKLVGKKEIILTDNVYKLNEIVCPENLEHETEARWNLVETAWEMNVSRNLLDSVIYDEDKKMFFVNNNYKRKDVTSSRAALNGYQKGKCFYCFDNISVEAKSENLCDVDHFIPHLLKPHMPQVNIDGVWNLVLACKDCNRGSNGKFEKVPAEKYLNRLCKRNDFLISSHHPLRETLITQTGDTEEKRKAFLKRVYGAAVNYLPNKWETKNKGEEVF